VAAAVIAILVTGWLTPFMQGDVRDELYEAAYQRTAANDRAGRFTYPGTARRQLRQTTLEQRERELKAFKASPQYLAAQAARTRPQWNRATFMTGALAIAMGALGWALGGLGRTGLPAVFGWCTLAWLALMVLGGRFQYPGLGVSQYIGRGPYWAPLAVFGTAAIAMLVANRRRQPTA
jgi:hypothetical protein